ncbi:MAG TPA: hypothetical protein VK671_05855 [Mucilaginibacter sp.]|jgi:uncharacterized membrane protein|nr:hypothetical protein [Mucilaginibacter sp.]
MKPLLVLLIASAIILLISHAISGGWDYVIAGNLGMAVMLFFTSVGHFIYSQGMMLMVPGFIPGKRTLIYITGVMEALFAIGLCIPSTRRLSADLLVLFFLLILPANINAAQKSVDYETASYEGRGISYLWLRIPMQLFFIAWAAYFGLIVAEV